ncbi:MAG: hypothetical protein Fur0032_13260 [Terrimicrobiaceae bacterium]
MQKKLKQIENTFLETVKAPIDGLTDEEVWEAARSLADQEFIKIIGFDAYNKLHLEENRRRLRTGNSSSPVR